MVLCGCESLGGGENVSERLEPVYMRVAEGMKFQRLSAGLSQAKMAEILKVPTNTYRNYETVTNRIPLHTLIDVAQYFNLSVNYFMEYGQDESSEKNKIVIELEDAEVVHAVTDIQGMGQECRKSVFEFMEFAKAKYKGVD